MPQPTLPAATGQDMKEWQKVFQELIQEVKPWHQWTLTLDKSLVPNTLHPGWTQYQQWVFARFKCSWCSRSWASAHVQVLFHMHWSKTESKGQVKMRIFAQRCNMCSQPPFEAPEFTEENMSRILNNLVLRILKNCYREGFQTPEEIPTIKDTALEGAHDMNNCEACLQGFCAQSGQTVTRGLDQAKLPPRSPPLPTVSLPVYKPSPLRGSPAVHAPTGIPGVKKGKASPSPWFSEPSRAKSPRANTSYRAESVIHVPSWTERSRSHLAQDCMPCHSGSRCCRSSMYGCLIFLIITVVLWWLFF